MSKRNLELRINIKFYIKILKSANPIKMLYSKHAMKKLSVF